MIRTGTSTTLLVMCVSAIACLPAAAQESGKETGGSFWSELPIEVHGFYEMRAGYRTRKDKFAKDMSIMENRFQLDLYSYMEWGDIQVKGDVFGDLVEEQADFDLREANIFVRPFDFMDMKIGRQILTWGTGDLIFINDLFPKDWQSFFVGRDVEYLKAPSDALKVSLFGDWVNLDIVYTPRFDPDRYIDGTRLSYWSSPMGSLAGNNAIVHTDTPDRWFRDDEIAARLYKTIKNYEVALYGYRGFWKSPGGRNAAMNQALFPDLNVYGASARGPVGKGIGNVEVGYYDSADDSSGKNALLNNIHDGPSVLRRANAGLSRIQTEPHLRPGPRPVQAPDHNTPHKAPDEPESQALPLHLLLPVRQGRAHAPEYQLQNQRQSRLGNRRKHILRRLPKHLLRPVPEQHKHLHRLAIQLLTTACTAAARITQIGRFIPTRRVFFPSFPIPVFGIDVAIRLG